MPKADNNGVRIHYEMAGAGPDLVLQHGLTQSIEDWVDCGYVAALQPYYRLILIDARGHGRSDKPHDEASYALEHRAGDVTCVLDALGVDRAHFWGYSMGAYIGFGMAKYAPLRVNALVLGGNHPFVRTPDVNRAWLREAIAAGGADALPATLARIAGPVSESCAARLRTNDLEALVASVPSGPGVEDTLPTMAMPCCVYAGDADPLFAQARAASERIPAARFIAFPGLAHLPAFTESHIVLPPIMAFLDSRPNAKS